jgi:hypothetical protein
MRVKELGDLATEDDGDLVRLANCAVGVEQALAQLVEGDSPMKDQIVAEFDLREEKGWRVLRHSDGINIFRFSGPAGAALRRLATGKQGHGTGLRHRCRHGGGEGDDRSTAWPRCARARVERRPGRACHAGPNYPCGKERDRSASPRQRPKAFETIETCIYQ